MQDNAPPHTAKITQAKLDDLMSWIDDWPAQSADLNPIENVWSWMANRLSAMQPAVSKNEMAKQLMEIWDDLELSHIRKLITSMPKRLQQVIDRKGASSDY